MDVVAHNQNRPTFRRSAFSWVGVSGCMPVKGDGDAVDLSALIVAIARDADRDSFARLFSAFAPKVKAYLLRLGASHAQAEEWVQDTFLTVWRKAAYYDPARAGRGGGWGRSMRARARDRACSSIVAGSRDASMAPAAASRVATSARQAAQPSI